MNKIGNRRRNYVEMTTSTYQNQLLRSNKCNLVQSIFIYFCHNISRNNIVFNMVACEQEYVQQLSVLISCFMRPLKMAASARKPVLSHEDANSIFLNM